MSMYPYYGLSFRTYTSMDHFYMFFTTLLALFGGVFSLLLGLAHFKKQMAHKQTDIMNIIYIHLSFNNFVKSVVGFLYGAVVLQTTWMEATYYKIRHRDTDTMKNNGSFVYCNIMGPIQEITIVQGVLLLCLLVCFKVSSKYFPRIRDFLGRKRRITTFIIGGGWFISIMGALCTFLVGETFYMDNMSGFCYTTENNPMPGVGILFFALPPLISCVVIATMLVILTYQYWAERREEEKMIQYTSSKTVIILIYTAVFVLCEAPLWIIYFIYNIREGIHWMSGNHRANEYYYGLFYHKYVMGVLKMDFQYEGLDLYLAAMYYPMYLQLTLTIETFIQTATLLVLQHDVLEWLYKMVTNRNMIKSFTKVYKEDEKDSTL